MIVNTDADNQYYGPDIPKLVAPILAGDADMVVGDREVDDDRALLAAEEALQRLGSWVVRQASDTDVPDTTSGFRAYNREAALQMPVVSKFTYTLETIIQAGKMLVAIDHVPIRTNPKTRESRLFPSMWSYVRRNAVSIFRIYAMYEPLRVFMLRRAIASSAALVRWGRFVVAYIEGDGGGHVQSLILGAVLFNAAMVLAALGVIGDLLSGQRIMLQRIFERVRRIELELGVPPSHYEPGARADRPAGRRRAHAAGTEDRGARGAEAVSSAVTRDAEGTVTGNTYDKYGSDQPRRPPADGAASSARSTSCSRQAEPQSLLDVGCGEGVLTHQWAQQLATAARRRHRPRRPGDPGRVGQAPPRRTSSTAS